MLQVWALESTNTGLAPTYLTTFAVAAKVNDGRSTSSPAPDAKTHESEVEGSGAARERHGVTCTQSLGELLLEGVDVGADRARSKRSRRLEERVVVPLLLRLEVRAGPWASGGAFFWCVETWDWPRGSPTPRRGR